MNDSQTLLRQAQELDTKGEYSTALERYSEAFNMLIDVAGKYALEEVREAEQVADPELKPELRSTILLYSKSYLKRDLMASTILTQMGVLFAALLDYPNAEQKLREAIEFIPEGEEYDEPYKQLAIITEAQAGVATPETFDE